MAGLNDKMRYKLAIHIVCVSFILFFFGCKSKSVDITASISHTKTDSTVVTSNRYRNLLDSIVKRDSIYIKDSISTKQVGDTIYTDRWHFMYMFSFFDRHKMDLSSLECGSFQMIATADTIKVPYPVEKELSKWQKFQLKYAVWSMGALCMILVWLGYKLYKWIKNGRYINTNRQDRSV